MIVQGRSGIEFGWIEAAAGRSTSRRSKVDLALHPQSALRLYASLPVAAVLYNAVARNRRRKRMRASNAGARKRTRSCAGHGQLTCNGCPETSNAPVASRGLGASGVRCLWTDEAWTSTRPTRLPMRDLNFNAAKGATPQATE